MIGYGQFCPVAKAAEILGERWTLLVVRELLLGTTRFNELQKALRKASPTILTKRLNELQDAGLVTRRKVAGQRYAQYQLTRSGKALAGLIEQMGNWAARWMPSQLPTEELDEYFLLLDISRQLVISAMPRQFATLGFRFRGNPDTPDWWLVVSDGTIDICDSDPGYEVDVMISASLRRMVSIWLGREALGAARRAGKIKIVGSTEFTRSLNRWLGYSAFAGASRS